MKLTWIIGLVVALGLAAAAWFYRGAVPVAAAGRTLGASTQGEPPTLQSVGVHKCVGPHGTSYIDGPCPGGSREVAATRGTLTVTSFPKTAPSPAAGASSLLGAPLVKPMDAEERDRLRDKAIEDAANRR